MDENMLTNLQRVMVFLRSDIKSKKNIDILCILIQAFDGLINNKEMYDEIIKIIPDWKTQLIYERYEYCFVQKEIIDFVKIAIQIMVNNLRANKFDIAYDIADILHVLPDVIIQKEKKGLKKYWKTYVERFNNKWKCEDLTKFKKYFRQHCSL